MLKTKDFLWITDDSDYQHMNAAVQATHINNVAEARNRDVCYRRKAYTVYAYYDEVIARIGQDDGKWVVVPTNNHPLTMDDIVVIHRVLDAIDSLEVANGSYGITS